MAAVALASRRNRCRAEALAANAGNIALSATNRSSCGS